MKISKAGQRGVVLFIALIMLVAMSMAGLGLMRSVGGGVMLAGNLSMKAITTRASDIATERAGAWLATNPASLISATSAYVGTGAAATGYSPVMDGDPAQLTAALRDAQGRFDPLKMSSTFWNTYAKTYRSASMGELPTAFRGDWVVQYIIHRMCTNPGAPVAQTCVTVPPISGARPTCSSGVDPALCNSSDVILYRVSIRITGPKNTESFVQVMVY